MSHDLFQDVTERRPRANRAAGGTLAVSIVAHALILTAVVVVPLLATDVLPNPADSVGAFVFDPPPPPAPPPPPIVPPPTAATTTTPHAGPVAPVTAPDKIVAEVAHAPAVVCAGCVVDPNAVGAAFGVEGGSGVGTPQPPPPPPPARPVRPGGDIRMPTKVRDVAPEYPLIAQQARVEGVVIIEAVIAVDGSVRDARVLRSIPLLDRAAIDAVRQWRYEPTRLNGVVVPVIVTVTVQFRLQR